jgi:hypothetical protein
VKGLPAVLFLVLLAACTAEQVVSRAEDTTHVAAASLDSLPNDAVCQIGPDGGPLIAHSAPTGSKLVGLNPAGLKPTQSKQAATAQHGLDQTILAERGIGGTGTPPGNPELADRGIGGTGIVGVITGFASVCVDGLEIAYDRSAAVDIDGAAGTPAALRVGQI